MIFKKLKFENNNINIFINTSIITYLILLIFQITFNHLFGNLLPESTLFEFIGNKTLNSVVQASLIISYFFLIITKKKFFKLDGFILSITILFFYSLIINLLVNDFNLLQLLNYDYHDSYYLKYFFNITTSLIIINELRNNFKLLEKCKNIIIFSSLTISLLFIVSHSLGYPVLGVNDALYEEKSFIDLLYSRFAYIGWNQNEISLFFNFAIAFIISKLLDIKTTPIYKTIFHVFCFLIIANGIILTGTRLALINLIVTLIFSFLYIIYTKSQVKRNIITLLFIFGALLARLRLFQNVFMYRFRIVDENGEINRNLFQLGERLDNWKYSYDEGFKSPLAGKGIIQKQEFDLPESTQIQQVQQVQQEIIAPLNNEYSELIIHLPENVFLEIFHNAGFIGLFLLLTTLFFFIKNNFILFIKRKDLENILLTICLFGAILSLNILYVKSFWFVLAICYAKTAGNFKNIQN